MLKFAANLSMLFKEFPLAGRFEQAAKAGFPAVEMMWPYELAKGDLTALLKKHHLQLALFNTSGGDTAHGEWGRAALPGREGDAQQDLQQALEYAEAAKCPCVHVMAGVVPEGADPRPYRDTLMSNLREAAPRFADLGITLTLEALCPEVKPRYLYSSQKQTLAIVQELGLSNVKVQFDTFHAQKADGDLSCFIQEHLPLIGHVQIAGVPDRHEPDEGEIDHAYLLALLDRLGYHGCVGCEYNPRTTTLAGLGWYQKFLKNA